MESKNLVITYGAYAMHGDPGWQVNSAGLHAARSSGYFYFSKMGFNTKGLDIGKSAKLSLTVTIRQNSNPYGTSAILTTSELTPSQVYNMTSESVLKATEGYVAYTHCTSHTVSGDVSSGSKVTYTFSTSDIKPNQEYFIYIKRRIGWTNATSGGVNGYTTWYNPCYTGANYAGYTTLTLTYEKGGYVNIDLGTSFGKHVAYIDNGTSFGKYVPYIDDGTAWHKYSK